MKTEFRIVSRLCEGHDFYEGVRAVIVDKDGRPRWDPPSLDDGRSAGHRPALRAPGSARTRGAVMARGHGTRQPLDVSRESAVDRLEERAAAAGVLRWGFVLTWFMRLLAVLWIIKGLSAWAVILGMWSPVGAFETRSTGYQATIIYFAVIDLVAAVGLWMASTWGGVMWLLAVMSHLILGSLLSADRVGRRRNDEFLWLS